MNIAALISFLPILGFIVVMVTVILGVRNYLGSADSKVENIHNQLDEMIIRSKKN